jgi:hypothetical protein
MRGRLRRFARAAGMTALAVAAVFLVGRAVVELIVVNPFRPETYRDDWGGPTYPGVLLVHAGPGIAIGVLAILALRRASARKRVHERPSGAGEHQDDDERRPQRKGDRGDR